LSQKAHWESDLTQIPNLVNTITEQVQTILEVGMRNALGQYCEV